MKMAGDVRQKQDLPDFRIIGIMCSHPANPILVRIRLRKLSEAGFTGLIGFAGLDGYLLSDGSNPDNLQIR